MEYGHGYKHYLDLELDAKTYTYNPDIHATMQFLCKFEKFLNKNVYGELWVWRGRA